MQLQESRPPMCRFPLREGRFESECTYLRRQSVVLHYWFDTMVHQLSLRHNTGIYPRVTGTRHFSKRAYLDPRVFSPAGIIGRYPGNTCRKRSNALTGSITCGDLE